MSVAPTIDVPLVRQLVRSQFPQWSHLEIRPVDADGWDNRTFRLGEQRSVRLPSASGYVPQVDKEVRWLPRLAEGLALEIPTVVGVGEPASRYPFPWTIREWIEGTPLAIAESVDRRALAADLAGFLRALRRIEPDGPPPGQHSSGRGGDLAQWDAETRRAVAALQHRIDADAALGVWREAVDARSPRAQRSWVHGDVAPGNLLLRRGRLAAVIDFGLAAVGDPACDLAMAWTWFEAEEREVLRAGLELDEATWTRGRGWALWKALITLDDPRHEATSARALTALGVA